MACMLGSLSFAIASPALATRLPSRRNPLPSTTIHTHTRCATGGGTFSHPAPHCTPLSPLSYPSVAPLSPLFSPSDDEADSSQISVAARILNPGLHHANIMWFNRPINAQITVGSDESADSMVRRFRKAVSLAGVIPECRRRRFFETPQDKIKRKKQALRKRRSRFKGPGITSGDIFAERDISLPVDADDDDNWDYEPKL